MADELDVEAMLEAPYKKEDDVSRNGNRKDKHDKGKDRKRDKRRSRSRERKGREDKEERRRERDGEREKGKDQDRGKDRDKGKDRGKDRERDRDRDKDRDRVNDRERDKDRGDKDNLRNKDREQRDKPRRSRSRERDRNQRFFRNDRGPRGSYRQPPWNRRRSPSPKKDNPNQPYGSMRLTREDLPELTPEERDARTVFCMQLPSDVRPRDIDEFFSAVGKVRDVRIITDSKTKRSKGIAYVEFGECESVPLALGLNGQKLKNKPILVQISQAEKNRIGNPIVSIPGLNQIGPMRLYVGSLHFNITEEMLRGIFAPFGKIDHINLVLDGEGRSKGFGFVTFEKSDDAKRALEQLNGFELAGRPMKVGHVTERTVDMQGGGGFDSDEMDRAGIDLGATGRLALMAKLAEGTGFEIPPLAANALSLTQGSDVTPQSSAAPPITTQCFMLSNMFDPTLEQSPKWDQEIKDDVIDECNKHGGVLHIFVDKNSPTGNVYVKCPTISAAVASVQALHGRFFAGKVITAAYVPLPNYHQLFADSQTVRTLLMSSIQQQAQLQYATQYGAAAGMMGAMQQGVLPR